MLDTNKLIPNRSTKSSLSPVTMTNFIVLKTDLVKIDSILKEKLVLSKVRAGIERQMIQNKRRKEREEELEKKKNKKEDEINIDGDQKKTKGGGGLVGFLIGSLIAGVGALVISALPTFIKIGKLIAKVARPIVRVTGALLNMFGKLVSNTFKAIRNVQDNFPLDKVQQLPKIVATIGAGIAGLVGAMATFSAANAVIGGISARSLKEVVEATKKQQKALGPGVRGGALTKPRVTSITGGADLPNPLMQTNPIKAGEFSEDVIKKIIRDSENMDFIRFTSERVPGLGFSRSEYMVSLMRLAEVPDKSILDVFDAIDDPKTAGTTLREIFLTGKNNVFDRLRGKVYLANSGLGPSLAQQIDDLRLDAIIQPGTPEMKRLKDLLKATVADIYPITDGRFDFRMGDDLFDNFKFKQTELLEFEDPTVARELPKPKAGTPISGTGQDAGALARQVLRNKKATKIVTKVVRKPILETFKTTARQTLGAVPLLGDLAVLMLDIFVFGEIPARAGFKTIGSIMGAFLGGFLGSLLPGPGTIVGAIIGGIAGDIIGGKIFDFLDISSKRSEVYRKDEDFGGDRTRDVSATDLTRAGLSGFADFATVKDLGGEIGKGMVFKNMEDKPEFLLEGDLYDAFKDSGFGEVLSTANALQGRGFEYLRTQLSYEKKRGRKTRFIPIGLPSQTSNPMVASTVQVIGSPDPSLVLNSLNRQILYKRG